MKNHSLSSNQKDHGSDNWPFRFLRWFCPPSLYEGIEGDLLEQFEAEVKNLGERMTWHLVRECKLNRNATIHSEGLLFFDFTI